MERIKEKDIEQALTVLNNMIEHNKVKVQLCGRYGYQALDLFNMEGGCLKTVRTGLTKREAFDAVNHMIEGIMLADEKRFQ